MSSNYEDLIEIVKDVFSSFPIIDNITDNFGGEYVLRQFNQSDAENYYKFYNEPEVKKFLPNSLIFKDKEEAYSEIISKHKSFQSRESVYWAIAEKKTDKLVGGCGFLDWSRFNKRIEIAYDLTTALHGKGIMSSVLPKIIAFAFLKMKVFRIQATTVLDNDISIHILTKKIGFQKDGILPKYKFYKEKYIDVNMFSYTAENFLTELKTNSFNCYTNCGISYKDIESFEQYYKKHN